MTLPADVRAGVEALTGRVRVEGSVGGGCVHTALRLQTPRGPRFLKYGRGSPPGFFEAEAECLAKLAAATRLLRVPDVKGWSDAGSPAECGWILLEWMDSARPASDFATRLAEGLSELHARSEGGWGWERPGFIATLPQDNLVETDWADFWRRRRLEPQLRLARAAGRLPAGEKPWQVLLDRLPRLLHPAEADGPSLLHGDLWGGNILATAGGVPAIVDPAAYRGHREVDLAMSELFGAQDAGFYRRYDEIRPLQPQYDEVRRGIYQLYYLLVHVNLFGEGYVAHTAATLHTVLDASS